MKKEFYTEIGFGNPTFVNTQINEGKKETRVSGFKSMDLKQIYMRLYLGWIVFSITLPFIWFRAHKKQIIFELGAVRLTLKKNFKFKLLLGFYGIEKESKK
ncbi:MAG: hypothetical protein JW812_01795 [Alphaproteobacteria bacterium]|nr:hypothetical protein [Alphaproteobacteria bacterium]MBN2779528.1 hypothetical protein [Alphaproteobacteria bacterium]